MVAQCCVMPLRVSFSYALTSENQEIELRHILSLHHNLSLPSLRSNILVTHIPLQMLWNTLGMENMSIWTKSNNLALWQNLGVG